MKLICILWLWLSAVCVQGQFPDIENRFLEIPDGNISFQYLADLSNEPSLAGTYGSFDDALYVSELFQQFGIPKVEIKHYYPLMSYPVDRRLRMLTPVPFTATLDEPYLPEDPTSNNPDIVDTFLGYAASGEVEADLVYVNYGRPEDFRTLAAAGVDLQGKIAIARYGQMFRGLKVQLAMQYEMAGVIIYSDPADDGNVNGDVYPEGPWRPPFAVQRGSTWFINLYSGDPLTPGVPALPELSMADRKYTYENCPALPRIPAIPIGYADAQPFLQLLEGIDVTITPGFEGWQGGLPFAYHVGGTGRVMVDLMVENEHPIRPQFDVVGIIPGEIEPDRQVLAGNHRDGWVFGARDPHCGTGPLLDIARAFGILYREGWRPRRTIKLLSWDGEEYGLHGSTEWAEEFQDVLDVEGVAYLNIDGGGQGLNFNAGGSPSLGEMLREVTSQIVNGVTGRTVYDEWSENGADIGNLGSGSDYTAFLDFLGMSSLNLGFGGTPSGVYHSIYDSTAYFDKFIDNEALELITKTLGLTILKLADFEVLPFDFREYGMKLEDYEVDLSLLFASQNIALDLQPLRNAIEDFKEAAEVTYQISQKMRRMPNKSRKELRELNDRMIYVERAFLEKDEILYKRPEGWYRHTIYAPSFDYGYNGVIFPGVTEAARDLELAETELQLDVLTRRIAEAAAVLLG